jgi:hypothetical protein
VGGAFLPLQLCFEPAVDGVGVDHLHQPPPHRGQLGGVQPGRVGEHHLLPPATDPLPRWEVVDGGHDQVRLTRRHRPCDQRLPGPGQRPGQRLRPGHPPRALTPAQPAQVGQPVPGRPVVQPPPGQVPCLDLRDRTGLDAGRGSDQLLDLLDHRHQLVIATCRPQDLPQAPQRIGRAGDHLRSGGAGAELRDRHTDIESATTDNDRDIHRVYPTIRDNPQKRNS